MEDVENKIHDKARSLHYLHKGIVSKLWTGQCGCGSQEPRVCHFFYSLSNRQYQSSIDEGHYDVSIKFICK